MTAKKQITQATFDETVSENIEEFELSREEAVKDAINQFTSQGVDLSNICVNYHESDERWLKQVEDQLESLSTKIDNSYKDELPASIDIDTVITGLEALYNYINDEDSNKSDNAKKLCASKQSINLIARLWTYQGDQEEVLLALSLDVARALTSKHEMNRDGLWPTSMSKLCQMIRNRPEDTQALLIKFMGCVRSFCTRSEDNKVYFVRYGGLDTILETLNSHINAPMVLWETCLALKAVTAVDDFRKDFSSAHQHTRQLLSKGAVPRILKCIELYPNNIQVVASALSCLKNLATNNESVEQIVNLGGLQMTTTALETYLDNPMIAKSAISVFRNVSADDKHKTTICNNGGAELMLKAMRKHRDNMKIQEHGLATIGAMALRAPDNCLKLVELGCISVTLQSLRTHREIPVIQRQGCLAIRNLVARIPSLIEAFLDAGAEQLLREAGRFQESVDEAYAALRDLKCEVKRLAIDPKTGKVDDMVQHFGQLNSNFKPVYDTSNEIEKSIEDAVVNPSEAFRF